MGRTSTLSEEEIEDLKYMNKEGFTRQQMADVLGISRELVYRYTSLLKLKSPSLEKVKDGKIYCPVCKIYLERGAFYKSSHSKSGVQSTCIECCKKRKQEKKKEKLIALFDSFEKTKEEVNKGPTRICSCCKIEKNIDNFHWSKKFKSLHGRCNDCRVIENKKQEEKRILKKGY